MKILALISAVALTLPLFAGEPEKPAADAPIPKITPGKVIIPKDKGWRRPWGELVSLDLATRTGTFRNEKTDEIQSFVVLPYAELLHHAADGDLQDFRIGERAIFRLHENEKGEWTWLTYIQDEMNMMNGHKEYFHVDAIDAANGKLTCTWASKDKTTFVREKGVTINTDAETRFWRAGQPGKFADIKEGDALRTKTHGVGKGQVRVAWEVFLDDESLLKFQAEQKAVHAKRLADEGAAGYVDLSADGKLGITLFRETAPVASKLKAGQSVRVAPAGVDRKPTSAPVAATITEIKNGVTTLSIDPAANAAFKPTGLFRLWTADVPPPAPPTAATGSKP